MQGGLTEGRLVRERHVRRVEALEPAPARQLLGPQPHYQLRWEPIARSATVSLTPFHDSPRVAEGPAALLGETMGDKTSCAGTLPPSEDLLAPREEIERLTAGPFFIQMSDTQLGFANTPVLVQLAGVTFDDDPSPEEIALFERAIAHANRLRPEFVVITGDLINVPLHPGQTAEFERIAARLAT